MKKKNLFNVKYVRVYLMLNALKMKFIDYKSIALPAELQGRHVIFEYLFYNVRFYNKKFINYLFYYLFFQLKCNLIQSLKVLF